MKKNNTEDVSIITYEANPTKENINYAFQKLVTPIIAATGYKAYQESHQEFK
jgi:dihydrodipicolinate reductase